MLICISRASTFPQSHRIRVEFHVTWLGHALPCVHLLDASPQVVPYLVQAYLFQSVGVLGPVWRHRRAPLSSPLPTEQFPPFPAPASVLPPAPLLGWFLAWLALVSECAVHLAAAVALWEAGCQLWDGMRSHSTHAWVAQSYTPPPKSFGTSHQMTCKGNEVNTKHILNNGKKKKFDKNLCSSGFISNRRMKNQSLEKLQFPQYCVGCKPGRLLVIGLSADTWLWSLQTLCWPDPDITQLMTD